jgi:hypothetical protein
MNLTIVLDYLSKRNIPYILVFKIDQRFWSLFLGKSPEYI